MCDAFIWGAVGGVPDALETLFARTVFGGYEGGTAWGGTRLEHEGGFLYIRIYMVRAMRLWCVRFCFYARAVLLFAYAFICGGAALGGVMGGSIGI